MSLWRLAVKELGQRGPLRAEQFMLVSNPYKALSEAQHKGLVVGPGKKRQAEQQPYKLTEKGQAFLSGKVVMQPRLCSNASRKVPMLVPSWFHML